MIILSLPWLPNTYRINSSVLVGSQGWHNLAPSPPDQFYFPPPEHHSLWVKTHQTATVYVKYPILFPVLFSHLWFPFPGIYSSFFSVLENQLQCHLCDDTFPICLNKFSILYTIPKPTFKHKEINTNELYVF